MPAPPLRGIRVLDLTRLLPGPYLTLLLADLGADVVKVESPTAPDWLRHVPPMSGDVGAQFQALNRNKRSIGLDLKHPRGAEVLLRLVATYDVVVEGFRPGVMDRLGVGYAALRSTNPRVVLCSVTGYGQDGPLADRAGHDANYLARAGVLGLTGTSEAPTLLGVQLADLGGSLFGALGLLAALVRRERTGEGAHVDVALADAAMGFLAPHLGRVLAGAELPAREADMLTGAAPCYRIYATADGRHMALGALEPKFWSGFCRAVGREDLEGRAFDADAGPELARLFASRTQTEWTAALAGLDVCCEPVLSPAEAAASEHAHARGLVLEGPGFRAPATPVRFAGEDPARPAPAPAVAAHGPEVLRSAGFRDEDIRELQALGVVLAG